MASGSQNMTTFKAKGLTSIANAVDTSNFIFLKSTALTADQLGNTVSLSLNATAVTGAAYTNHSIFLNAGVGSGLGTPFQLQIPDSSHLYIYKRWYTSGAWSGWSKMRAGTADTWTTTRTLTIGDTGKAVDGSANVSWSKDEILGASTNAYFLRGDKAWSNTLNGAFTANGTITANGGYLKSTANSNTVTIGSQNASFTHIYNSANIPFIFNNTVESTTGDLGSTSYPWHNIYIGPSNGAGIYYKGTKNTYRMIRFIDNTSDGNGNGISIGGGGLTVLGSGESADTILSNLSLTGAGGTETTYIGSDGSIEFYPSINSWDASARIWMTAGVLNIGVDGNTTRENSLNIYSGAGRIQLYSAASKTGNRGLWVPAHGSGSSKNIILVDTNNNITFNGNVTGNCSGSSGSCTGNAATATKATQDGSGNTITSYYCTLSTAQTISGAKTFTGNLNIGASGAGGYLNGSATNGGINSIRIGDDVWLGDCNAGGIMGMKSTGANCGFYMYNSSGTQIGQLYFNDTNLYCNKTIEHPDQAVSYIAGAKGTGAALYAKKAYNADHWYPAVALETKGGGAWQIGNYNDETLEFQYATKANRDSNKNSTSEIYMQQGDTGRVVTSENYTNWTVTKTGSGASGSWGISVTGSSASCTGNAASASKCASDSLTNVAFSWSSSYTTGDWMLIHNGETGTNGGQLFRAINQANTAAWVDGAHKWTRIGGDTMTGSIKQKMADVTRGSSPSANQYRTYEWIDNGNKRVAQVEYGMLTSGESRLHLYVLGNNTTSTGDEYGGIIIYKKVGVSGNTAASYNANNGTFTATKVYNAVWNDYAECRQAESIEPGRVFTESTSGIMKITTKRLMPACKISSDTFGTCMGETSNAKTPIAVAGRVLVYPYRARTEYKLGAAVCSAPNGTIDIMTREEIREYPERIIGTVSEIPDYEVWHAGERDGNYEIEVNGRIWIYVR